MKPQNSTKQGCIAFVSALILILMPSCVKEDTNDCSERFYVRLKAVDVDGKDITESGDLKEARIFLFDEEGRFVDICEMDADAIASRKSLYIYHPGKRKIHFVSWANVDEAVDYRSFASMQRITDLTLRLRINELRIPTLFALSPSDLFFGKLSTDVAQGSVELGMEREIVVERKTCQVNVLVKNLKHWNKDQGGDYSVRIRRTASAYDYQGLLTGDDVSYFEHLIPSNIHKELRTQVFRTFPTCDAEPSFVVDLLKDGTQIYTTQGTEYRFIPEVGRMLNILIDFAGSVDISTVVTPWNEVHQFVTY